jgi:phage tail sheath gpL-like
LGTELEVATSAGQTAGQVAYAIADAIRADPILLGVQSTVAGNFIVITAPVDSVYSGDGGIQISVPSGIPALSPSLVALLGFAMLALGYRVVRRRNFP